MAGDMNYPFDKGGKVRGRIDAFVRPLWLDALRSGNFAQGKGALCRRTLMGDRFDPIGVLSEIYRRETGKGRWQANHPHTLNKKVLAFVLGKDKIDMATAQRIKRWWIYDSPPEVLRWAKLHYRDAAAIQILNDKGTDFDEIADWIEMRLQDS